MQENSGDPPELSITQHQSPGVEGRGPGDQGASGSRGLVRPEDAVEDNQAHGLPEGEARAYFNDRNVYQHSTGEIEIGHFETGEPTNVLKEDHI